ncbi:MAG: tripartite tricarboxylate transporter TctB family protein [Rhodospirillales bacterium]|jgi:putative tricarboxylic transport membrane protein|nr:tripartite tricarboxylate transporter TctB family protein [Rhodospirillales bacterium]
MNVNINRQALFALLLIALDAGYFFQSLSLPRPFQLGEPGPAFLPIVLSAFLFISCAGVIWQELTNTAEPEVNSGASAGRIRPRSIALVVASAAFIIAFDPLGYWIATFFYTTLIAWLFERERDITHVRALVTSTCIGFSITAVGWLFFVTLFGLFLPTGVF